LVDVQTVGVLIATASVTVGAAYYMLTLRATQRSMKNTLETRQVQMFMNIYSQFWGREFQSQWNQMMDWEYRDLDEFMAKYGHTANPEAWTTLTSVCNFFEGIGVLIYRGYIDRTLVDDLTSGFVLRLWDKIKPIAYEYRKRNNWPQAFEWVEYLHDEIRAIAESQNPELRGAELRV
jgi:hypothetical protein